MRRQLSYCISKLKKGETIKIAALGQLIPKAIVMTEIAKERIGWLHQVNNFSTSFASEDKEARVGIVIQLTKNAQETDLTAVGYQKPKAPTFDSHLSKFILV